MNIERQEAVRQYLRGWSERDWEHLDDLYNDGVPLPEALVQVHRFRTAARSQPESARLDPTEPALEQPLLGL